MTIATVLTIDLVLLILVGINGFMAYKYYVKNYTPPISIATGMRVISEVYDIIDILANKTKAHKVAIAKIRYTGRDPYFELIYDNDIPGEERYSLKYNRMPMDKYLIKDMVLAASGEVVRTKVGDMPDSIRKSIYTKEGVIYSESAKIIEVGEFLYILVFHYDGDKGVNDDEVGNKYLNKLIKIFKTNKHSL